MIAVIFEVEINTEKRDDYFDLAARLRPLLEKIDGFLSIERFQCLSDPDCLLSLSFWRDESAVQCWRNQAEHRLAQQVGRESVFRNYRLRVATVERDYGMHQRDQAPRDSASKN